MHKQNDTLDGFDWCQSVFSRAAEWKVVVLSLQWS